MTSVSHSPVLSPPVPRARATQVWERSSKAAAPNTLGPASSAGFLMPSPAPHQPQAGGSLGVSPNRGAQQQQTLTLQITCLGRDPSRREQRKVRTATGWSCSQPQIWPGAPRSLARAPIPVLPTPAPRRCACTTRCPQDPRCWFCPQEHP